MINAEIVSRFISYAYATDALKFARFDCKCLSGVSDMASQPLAFR